MTELFTQLCFVSSVLAGFAFSFVGGLLSSSSPSRIYGWAFSSALFAAVTLTVAAVGAVFAGLAFDGESAQGEQRRTLHQLVSQTFLLGILGLLVAAGCVGWLKSRQLGIVSVIIAVIGFLGMATVVMPFLRMQ